MGQPETSSLGGVVRPEIAFFDVETTIPRRAGQKFEILEFGAILVCARNLEEIDHYSTLVRPPDLSLIAEKSVRCNGITAEGVASAPLFRDIADKVYDILQGRIWAGHNIIRFDCARIREAFARIGRNPPEPRGIIDSLALLTEKFGRRAGNMKMATLATYFGLTEQTHRSLDDVRLNLEVLKHCATVLFLESSLPDILTESCSVSPNATRRRQHKKKSCNSDPSSSSTFRNDQTSSPQDQRIGVDVPIVSLLTRSESEVSDLLESNAAQPHPFDMSPLSDEVKVEFIQKDIEMGGKPVVESPQATSSAAVFEGCSVHTGFLQPDEVSIPSIRAAFVPFYRGVQKIKLFYENIDLQLSCTGLKIRFGISTKFVDSAGRPRLSFVVDASPSLCRVLDACDNIVQKQFSESGSCSEWRPVVSRKNSFFNNPTVRLHVPTVVNGENATYSTEIYQRESSGVIQKLAFTKFDPSELGGLLKPGTIVDTCISLDPYDYQQNSGIRLVAKKLIVNSN